MFLKQLIKTGSFQNSTFEFIKDLEKSGTKKLVLFCVEKSPDACHRSLVTNKLKEIYPDIHIFDL